MNLVPSTIEAYPVQHLPLVKAYADKISLVEVSHQVGPTEMAIDPGTIVLGMILATLSGRSPWSRLEECFAPHDTARLWGQAVAPEACDEDTVGRVFARLYDTGTMHVLTAWAVRADQVLGVDTRDGPCATTAMTVYGDDGRPEETAEPQVPLTSTSG